MDKKNKTFKNYCSRCGKERIISRVWKEKIGFSIVEVTERVCPDKECQKIIDNDLAKVKKKRLETEKKRQEMIKNRRKKVFKKGKEVSR